MSIEVNKLLEDVNLPMIIKNILKDEYVVENKKVGIDCNPPTISRDLFYQNFRWSKKTLFKKFFKEKINKKKKHYRNKIFWNIKEIK